MDRNTAKIKVHNYVSVYGIRTRDLDGLINIIERDYKKQNYYIYKKICELATNDCDYKQKMLWCRNRCGAKWKIVKGFNKYVLYEKYLQHKSRHGKVYNTRSVQNNKSIQIIYTIQKLHTIIIIII